MDTKPSGFTLKVDEGEATIPDKEALIVVEPPLRPLARPPVLIVATEVAVELHCTDCVMSCVLPSLYVPIAVNCWFCPI